MNTRISTNLIIILAGSALFTGGCGDLEPTGPDERTSVESSTPALTAGTTTAYEAETLARTASAIGSKVTSDAAASGGKYVEFNGAAAPGAWIEFTLPMVAAGTYDLKFLFKSNTNRGTIQASIDGSGLGPVCNEYAASASYKVGCSLGIKTLSAGSHKIRFTVSGKVSASSGYQMVVDQIALTTSVGSAGCGIAPTLGTGKGQALTVNGTTRSFALKVPDTYDRNKPYRLVVAYHWLNGTSDNLFDGSGTAKAWYGLAELANESTIFVAPQGTNNRWVNSGGVDVQFSNQLIQRLESALCIDTSRIFVEGFSMGGSMAYAMACAAPSTLRGVAIHSGALISGCVSHNTPLGYYATHGNRDAVVAYSSGVSLLQDFARINGCTAPDPNAANFQALLPVPTTSNPACVDFMGCKAGYPVRFCPFVGDHTPAPGGVSTSWVPADTWRFISQF